MKIISKVAVVGLLATCCTAFAADVLTGKDGMTLYTFDKDSDGKSVCVKACATTWPPAAAGDATGKGFGHIERGGGKLQLTYNGKPLYYYVKDEKPGDTNGDNVAGIWHVVAKPKE